MEIYFTVQIIQNIFYLLKYIPKNTHISFIYDKNLYFIILNVA